MNHGGCGGKSGRGLILFIGLIASMIGGNALQFGNIPVVPILEAAIISVLACLIASAIPLRSVAKAEIVKSISSME